VSITPAQLAKSGSEHGEQVALFAWIAIARVFGFKSAWDWAEGMPLGKIERGPAVEVLEWIHAIPNGGTRGDDEKTRAIRGGALKAEGVRDGVADIFLPVPLWNVGTRGSIAELGRMPSVTAPLCWHGLYIEMKRADLKPKKAGSKGGASDAQLAFGDFVLKQGYGWKVCYGWRDAAETIQSYITYGN
jgi:hypothetical protein